MRARREYVRIVDSSLSALMHPHTQERRLRVTRLLLRDRYTGSVKGEDKCRFAQMSSLMLLSLSFPSSLRLFFGREGKALLEGGGPKAKRSVGRNTSPCQRPTTTMDAISEEKAC